MTEAWLALLIGYGLDLCFGDPHWMPHPVVLMGKCIAGLERALRRLLPAGKGGELVGGALLALVLPLGSFGVSFLLLHLLGLAHPLLRLAGESFMCYQILATKCLRDESMAVYRALKKGDLPAARRAVGRIVGRDTQALTAQGVTKAAVETVAENTGDGIVAPLFFMMLGGAPLFHTWGVAALQLGLVLGATLVLRRKFDPQQALQLLQRHRCTSMFAVPVMLQRILDLPADARRPYDCSSLRIVACSGSALPADLADRFQREFGPVLYNFYGSTEVSWVSIATPEDLRTAPGTAGRPPRGTTVRILDEDGAPVRRGETGRIFAGNDMLFEGYTSGTRREVRDGLMATGDLGRIDSAGRLFVVGREDDMIVSGGENVYPKETEDAIGALPEVADVAVVGVDDADFGQRLAAYVVLREPGALDAEGLRDRVRDRLPKFALPRDVVFVDSLPRNATGKVVARELKRS